MFPLEDADLTDGAVPGPGRLNRLARRAELPLLPDRRRQNDVAGRSVRQPQSQIVADNVDQQKDADGDMEVVGVASVGVQVRQNNVHLVDKRGRDHERDEEEGPDVRDLLRKDILSA